MLYNPVTVFLPTSKKNCFGLQPAKIAGTSTPQHLLNTVLNHPQTSQHQVWWEDTSPSDSPQQFWQVNQECTHYPVTPGSCSSQQPRVADFHNPCPLGVVCCGGNSYWVWDNVVLTPWELGRGAVWCFAVGQGAGYGMIE